MEPILSLAFTMHANKGAYALLLGSGISRAASIPTGWEMTLDLVRQVCLLEGEDDAGDPVGWYRSKYGKEPDYSDLLDRLAPTPSERSLLLKKYFEPTDDEREQGIKRPTLAHKAIARLMKDGYIRVVVTTNFDRLLEDALAEVGAPAPTVIATADAVDGALPLSHPGCFIVKIHGDYLDMRIKNTIDELSAYDPRLDGLLDRILDEFGMITCGWSADWDIALKSAFERCKGRRFGTYWTNLSTKLGSAAEDLVKLRGATKIQIKGADDFFCTLEEKLTSLAEYERPHPLSVQAAIATIKRYIVDDSNRIRLDELFRQEAENLYGHLSPQRFPLQISEFNENKITERINEYDRLTDMLGTMMITAAFWGEQAHQSMLIHALERIGETCIRNNGYTALIALSRYPVLRLSFAASMAAIVSGKYETFFGLLTKPQIAHNEYDAPSALITEINYRTIQEHRQNFFHLFNGESRKAPLADHLFGSIRPLMQDLVPSDRKYEALFEKAEYLWSLSLASIQGSSSGPWYMAGRLVYKWPDSVESGGVKQVNDELANQREDWPLLKAGLFKKSFEVMNIAKTEVDATFDDIYEKMSWA